jgi:hypothetical protein
VTGGPPRCPPTIPKKPVGIKRQKCPTGYEPGSRGGRDSSGMAWEGRCGPVTGGRVGSPPGQGTAPNQTGQQDQRRTHGRYLRERNASRLGKLSVLAGRSPSPPRPGMVSRAAPPPATTALSSWASAGSSPAPAPPGRAVCPTGSPGPGRFRRITRRRAVHKRATILLMVGDHLFDTGPEIALDQHAASIPDTVAGVVICGVWD